MKLKIKEIYSCEMFPGLLIGKPEDGYYEKALDNIKKILLYKDTPIINFSEVKWTQFDGYGDWGHILQLYIVK